jgi:hypothetical protein
MEPDTAPTPSAPTPRPRTRVRRVLAVAAGVAMVPALYAAAVAATHDGGGKTTLSTHSAAADDPAPEVEVEHPVPEPGDDNGVDAPEATIPTAPEVTTPTSEPEVEHPVPEPGDDNGVDVPGDDDDQPSPPVSAGQQSFTSAGGSITVVVSGGSISLGNASPAAGFTTEVHDNGPTRVEVRFSDGSTEWRIRVEIGPGGLTSEITDHG